MFGYIYKMKNRTPEQAKQHREYMKEYYRKNESKRIKNRTETNKRGLELILAASVNKILRFICSAFVWGAFLLTNI